jgi:spermidine synthase
LIPWEQLDAARTPDGKQELRLKRRGSEFSIMLGSNELMNSRLSGSEEALARLSLEKLGRRDRINVLIGGLGMGFTLRAALAELGSDARVTVAELVPAVIAWARGPMTTIFNGCLEDARVAISQGDVTAAIDAARREFDAILLDVDNGPEGLTQDSNDTLYGFTGLKAAHNALTAGGVLAVWSSGPDRGFTRRLQQSGFIAEAVTVRAHGKRGAKHTIWLAVKPHLGNPRRSV